MVNILKAIIKGFAFIVCTIVWFIVGLFIWIPLLVRITTVYCAKLIYNTTVRNSESDTVVMEGPFEHAIDFWFLGFRTVYRTFYDSASASSYESDSEFKFFRFLVELIWVVVFYFLMDFLFLGQNIPKFYRTNFTSSSKTDNSNSEKQHMTRGQIDSIEKVYTNKIDSIRFLYIHKVDSVIAVQEKNKKRQVDSTAIPTMYIVKAKDGLYAIARKFHVTIAQIREWNKLTSDNLSVGQRLQIFKNED